MVSAEEVPELLNGSKTGEAELRRDLKKARHQLKQYETKIRAIEEEHRLQLQKLGGGGGQDKSPKADLGFKTQFELL